MIGLVLVYDHRVDGPAASVEATAEAIADTEQSLETGVGLVEWLPDADDRLAALGLFFLTWRSAHPDIDGDDHEAFSSWLAGLDDIRVDPEHRFLTDALAGVGDLGIEFDPASVAED